jgi:hypothetical protein
VPPSGDQAIGQVTAVDASQVRVHHRLQVAAVEHPHRHLVDEAHRQPSPVPVEGEDVGS